MIEWSDPNLKDSGFKNPWKKDGQVPYQDNFLRNLQNMEKKMQNKQIPENYKDFEKLVEDRKAYSKEIKDMTDVELVSILVTGDGKGRNFKFECVKDLIERLKK